MQLFSLFLALCLSEFALFKRILICALVVGLFPLTLSQSYTGIPVGGDK